MNSKLMESIYKSTGAKLERIKEDFDDKYALDNSEADRDESIDAYGLFGYDVDGRKYLVGTPDMAHEAALKISKEIFDSAYSDEDKVNWLQKWNWPGVDKEAVCEALGDDPSDYEEGESVWTPSSIEEYIDGMGYKNASDCLSWDFLSSYTDLDEVAEFVVSMDGEANSIASYDGEEIDLDDGNLAYRIS